MREREERGAREVDLWRKSERERERAVLRDGKVKEVKYVGGN